MTEPASVLVADDETNIRKALRVCLEAEGARVFEAKSTQEAVAIVARESLDLALVDLKIGAESGLDLIPKLLARQHDLPIVMITAYATVETAVEAIKRGARDYLPKPFTPAQVRHALGQVVAMRRRESRLAELEERVQETIPEADLTTRNATFRAALETAFKAAASDSTILLRGETGTGKGVLARAIHARSSRAEQPFVTVSGASFTSELFASELFGHVKGAFTGAVRDQPGKVEAARKGTLFLDEVGEVEPSLQAKLLRLLQEREYERVGETTTRRSNARFIAATNRDLEALVREGRFREDLLFRLNVIDVRVPPLRERPEDIEPLASSFLAFFSRGRVRPLRFGEGFVERLRAHPWPGNVRELKNAIERVAILASGDVVDPGLLPVAMGGAVASGPRLGDPV
ncbi:MAG TPA: sigma-54 dependent transcriptional regulator, partial [Planctomycetota bacterium]|nr:sigma-54 dependent transcriptional regulator [Planctomycetota bacterium]